MYYNVGNISRPVKHPLHPSCSRFSPHSVVRDRVLHLNKRFGVPCRGGKSVGQMREAPFRHWVYLAGWHVGHLDVAGDWLRNYIDILKGAWRMRDPDGLHLPSKNKLGFLSALTFKMCVYLCVCFHENIQRKPSWVHRCVERQNRDTSVQVSYAKLADFGLTLGTLFQVDVRAYRVWSEVQKLELMGHCSSQQRRQATAQSLWLPSSLCCVSSWCQSSCHLFWPVIIISWLHVSFPLCHSHSPWSLVTEPIMHYPQAINHSGPTLSTPARLGDRRSNASCKGLRE